MATKEEKYKNLNEQQKKAYEKMSPRQRLRLGLPAQIKRQKQIAKPKIQERRKNAQLIAEIASYAIPGFGAVKIGKALAKGGPKLVEKAKTAVGKNNRDAIRLAFGLDKKVGGAKSNLVSPRIKKGPDGKPLGARPVGKGVVKKAKNIRRGAAATGAAAATAAALKDEKKQKSKPAPKKRVEKPIITKKEKPRKEPPVSTTKADDPTEGGRYAFYPGQTSKDLGLMYEVDKNKMSDEVRERIEESELYEGDSKGGRVGKGKKKKVSQAPRGVRAALRGFKPNMGASKGNKRTRGTGGGWV